MNERQLFELGRKVAEAQDTELADGAVLEAARHAFNTRLALPRPERRLAPRLALAGALCAAAVVLAMFWSSTRSTPLRYALDESAEVALSSRFVDAASTPRVLRFSDGTSIALAPHSALRVLAVDAHGARVALEQGSVTVDVVHRDRETRWDFEAGPYRVHVVGTRFELGWQREAGHFSLHMKEGRVRLEGPSVQRTLGPGDSFATPEPEASSVREAGTRDVAPLPPVTDVAAMPEAPPTPEPARENASDEERALEVMLRRAQAAEQRDAPEAKSLYQRIRTHHGGTQAASEATFLLARLEGETPRAVALLETYLREAPRGRYVDAALGRLLRTTRKLGDLAAAQRYASRYLARYPEGPYAVEAREVISSAP